MTVAAGTRLGPYEVAELLGAGGMGAVYRARDPRLGRDVAIKVLPDDVAADPDRLRRFEQEARAVAALNHPHIVTVHDVGTDEGTPYVVTELLEGENLREVLARRKPTQRQILAWAVQTAQGLAAAHHKGIVHRDLKPENLFLTTDGRVKILDFGLARLARATPFDSQEPTASNASRPGLLLGTVPYMSPEQVKALPVDARSDIFSFGVVLYELLTGKHPFRRETAVATLSAILEETPAELWSLDRSIPRALDGIVRRCLEKNREERFQGAHDLALALEAVLQAPTGAAFLGEVEERSPYPGLQSFTEKDAGHFFGREGEVQALWERIRGRTLLAVIGPSGVGKTSFLRAGVFPSRPEGWGAVHATPGANPGLGLARALTPELAGDTEAMEDLLSGLAELTQTGETARVVSAVKRWRARHVDALVVVDQFEELFTLNPPETQQRFAVLIGRLASEADVHVVLSLRDDFLMRCHEQPALAPVFSELTPLGALTAEGLESAVVEPAKKQGYHFDDLSLVAEMVSIVEGVRGALPLLAFAVARLWEKRDRQGKVLTREAYREIAGVEGALAQHAEATMDRIGPEKQGLVREIFRNLVTSHGTRAVVDREELLSAFPDRGAAESTLRQLIDARLITSYEVEAKEGEASHHRVEVVHESLLKAWPRLVRWQAQDEEGALLRDQLKQAAHLWEEKGRTADLLWTGTAHREYELWRERYAGALTVLEEDFAKAMADKAQRKKRLVRLAAAAAFVAVSAVAVAIGVSRHQATQARDQARAEALRAEASKLLALAQAQLAEDPTEALAYTTASLELADTGEARLFALRALAEAPPALETPGIGDSKIPRFSPDGHWLAVAGHSSEVGVWSEDGSPPLRLPGHETGPRGGNLAAWASPSILVTGFVPNIAERAYVWSIPEGRRIRTIDFGAPSWWQVGPSRLFAETVHEGPRKEQVLELRSWQLSGGEPQALGRVNSTALGARSSVFEPNGNGWLYTKGSTTYLRPFSADRAADRVLSRHDSDVSWGSPRAPNRLFERDAGGRIRVWSFSEKGVPSPRTIPRPGTAPPDARLVPAGRWVTSTDRQVRLWDPAAWPEARPLELRRTGSWYIAETDLHPLDRWLVATTGGLTRLTFWPLPDRWPTVVDGYAALSRPVAFSPDGRWLATAWTDNRLRLWPLPGAGATEVKVLGTPPVLGWGSIAFDPNGKYLFAVGFADSAWIVPLDGSPGRKLAEYSKDTLLWGAAVSPTGRRVATAFQYGKGSRTLRVADVDSGAVRLFDLPEPGPDPGSAPRAPTGYEGGIESLVFVDDSTLYTAGHGGIRRWNLETGSHDLVADYGPAFMTGMVMSGDRQVAYAWKGPLEGDPCGPLYRVDVPTGASVAAPQFGECVPKSPSQAGSSVFAVGGRDGVVRVSRFSGGDVHLLPGHVGVTTQVAVSPDLRWIASTGEDGTLRLWPMPDLDQPPLHALPRDQLLAKLKSLTNIRAVRDPAAPSGWKIELGPFPGWKDVPTW